MAKSLKDLLSPMPEGFWSLVEVERQIEQVAVESVRVARRSGLSRREIASRMGLRSPSTVQRIVGAEAYNVTVETLIRFASACGYRLKLSFEPMQSSELDRPQLRVCADNESEAVPEADSEMALAA